MKVLVTGGAGFIGSHTVDLLVHSGHEVLVVDHLRTGRKEYINKKAAFVQLDVNDQKVEQVFNDFRPDILLHLAAQERVSLNPFKQVMDRITGTMRLLFYCEKYGIQKVVFASSGAVYGENHPMPLQESFMASPVTHYGVAAFTCEAYIRLLQPHKHIPFTILRYANVYGPRQPANAEGGVVSIFLDSIMENKPLMIYGDGEQTRDFIYVEDVAKANLAAMTKGSNEIINISSETSTSIIQLFDICKVMLKSDMVPEYQSARAKDVRYCVLSNSKARELLDWKPSYTLEEGLTETVDSLLNP